MLLKSKVISRLATRFILGHEGETYACASRKSVEPLAVGDWVEWQITSANEGVIEALLERKNVLTRPNPLTQFEKPIAANIDLMIVVVATQPSPDLSLLDEYLVITQLHEIDVLIVHNKKDLPGFEQSFENLQDYTDLSYSVLDCSSETQAGLDELMAAVENKTCVFLGQSGVGKSSLINALLSDTEQRKLRTQVLSDKSEGKHTTSHSTLFPLANGGEIIDSPGIREFGLWKLTESEIVRGFIEIHSKSVDCKFHNCHHLKEPKCAVKLSVECGDIAKRRYSSYCHLVESLVNGMTR